MNLLDKLKQDSQALKLEYNPTFGHLFQEPADNDEVREGEKVDQEYNDPE